MICNGIPNLVEGHSRYFCLPCRMQPNSHSLVSPPTHTRPGYRSPPAVSAALAARPIRSAWPALHRAVRGWEACPLLCAVTRARAGVLLLQKSYSLTQEPARGRRERSLWVPRAAGPREQRAPPALPRGGVAPSPPPLTFSSSSSSPAEL
jgi:hypothetical protein